jgi:hypothetical protein
MAETLRPSSGASRNEFHVWAGPRYNLDLASDPNAHAIFSSLTPGLVVTIRPGLRSKQSR